MAYECNCVLISLGNLCGLWFQGWVLGGIAWAENQTCYTRFYGKYLTQQWGKLFKPVELQRVRVMLTFEKLYIMLVNLLTKQYFPNGSKLFR